MFFHQGNTHAFFSPFLIILKPMRVHYMVWQKKNGESHARARAGGVKLGNTIFARSARRKLRYFRRFFQLRFIYWQFSQWRYLYWIIVQWRFFILKHFTMTILHCKGRLFQEIMVARMFPIELLRPWFWILKSKQFRLVRFLRGSMQKKTSHNFSFYQNEIVRKNTFPHVRKLTNW